MDKPDGQIWHIIIFRSDDEVHAFGIISTPNTRTGPNVLHCGLGAYISASENPAAAVFVKSLFAFYQEDCVHSEDDFKLFGGISSAIGVEKER